MAGHSFLKKEFEYVMRCALCAKYCPAFSLLIQCTTCYVLGHRSCFASGHFLFKSPCLDSSTSSSMAEAKRQHERQLKVHVFNAHLDSRIVVEKQHQWVSFLNLSANWCRHCGYLLSLGQGNQEGANRRCEACKLTCHAQCQPLVSGNCGSRNVKNARAIVCLALDPNSRMTEASHRSLMKELFSKQNK